MGSSLCCIKASPPPPSPNSSLGHRQIRSITLDEYLARKKKMTNQSADAAFAGTTYRRRRVVIKTITLDEFNQLLKSHPDAGKRPISPREVLEWAARYERVVMRPITLDEYLARKKNPAQDARKPLNTTKSLTPGKNHPAAAAGKRPITPAAEDVLEHQSSLVTNGFTLDDEFSKIQVHASYATAPSPHVMMSSKSAEVNGTQELKLDEIQEEDIMMLDQCKPKKKVSFRLPEVTC